MDQIISQEQTDVVRTQKILVSQEEQNRLARESQQAFDGARSFLYIFMCGSMSVHLLTSLIRQQYHWFQLATLVISFFSSIHYYKKCCRTSSHIPKLLTEQKGFFCGYCKINRPLRVKHCLKCNECIYQYDHHCFWVGRCIGQLNQRVFFLFVASMTVYNVMMVWAMGEGCWFMLQQTEDQGVFKLIGWTEGLLTLFAIGFSLFTGFLLFYHLMLMLSGQTTWQHIRRSHITYLKDLPRGHNPFSQGFIGNIRHYFRKNPQPTEWQPSSTYSFNLFDNQYYSCC